MSATNSLQCDSSTIIVSGDGREGVGYAWSQRILTTAVGSIYVSKTFLATKIPGLLGRLTMIRPRDRREEQKVLDTAIRGAIYLSKSFWPRSVIAAVNLHKLLRSVDHGGARSVCADVARMVTNNLRCDRSTMICSRDDREGVGNNRSQRILTTVVNVKYISKTFWDVLAINYKVPRLLGGLTMIRPSGCREGGDRRQKMLDNAIAGAIYLSKLFWPRGVAATKVQKLLTSLDHGGVLRRKRDDVDITDLMERAWDKKYEIRQLMALLKPYGVGKWKPQAHSCAQRFFSISSVNKN